jgi:hypothetical protein
MITLKFKLKKKFKNKLKNKLKLTSIKYRKKNKNSTNELGFVLLTKSNTNNTNKFKTKVRTNKRTKVRTKYGGGIFDMVVSSIGKSIYSDETETKKETNENPIGSNLLNMINPDKIEKKVETKLGMGSGSTPSILSPTPPPTTFNVIFNYRKPDQLDINTLPKRTTIKSSKVEYEPQIMLGMMDRFIIVLFEIQPIKRMLWISIFQNYSKYHTILSYIPPKPDDKNVHNYVFQMFKFPKEVPQFEVTEMTTEKRKEIFVNFFKYINDNKLSPAIDSKLISVIKDESQGMDLFNLLQKSEKYNRKQNRLASTPS